MPLLLRSWVSIGHLRFGPMAQCVVHVLKGLACRARVTPANLPASHCKQCSALTSPSLHVRGCASPSRARVTLASLPASQCKQCSALTERRLPRTASSAQRSRHLRSARARLRQCFSRTRRSQKHNFSMGPKLRYPAVHSRLRCVSSGHAGVSGSLLCI